ncbi:hypothetical protein GDO81_013477 [Engystomops pustulosus]|uniref:Uncharacterized protein n=1 Tax=Engystomops pustulosus TaxID=76066 RepID=A0AAV7B454_ENGPU|nr:hypothetical protein GDO81_013477 [Engystomops pustulosus]
MKKQPPVPSMDLCAEGGHHLRGLKEKIKQSGFGQQRMKHQSSPLTLADTFHTQNGKWKHLEDMAAT